MVNKKIIFGIFSLSGGSVKDTLGINGWDALAFLPFKTLKQFIIGFIMNIR